jgi:adenosylcobinamide kinase/adenosylcobinamide-phosphate guanylyltransferase
MHVFIGGAHNGKRHYVRKLLEQQGDRNVQWFEGDLGIGCTHRLDAIQTIVVAGIEKWLAETDMSEEQAISHVMETVKGRNVIFILTDIGRGIVPMDAGQRKLRDACGRLYQRLMIEADEVTRIWYGLAQTLKKRGETI